jgi:hypothetical protein
MKIMIRSLIAITIMYLTGCAMVPSAERALNENMQFQTDVSRVSPDKATVVFMRPSQLGWLISAPVFELIGDIEKLIGVSTYGTRIDYQTTSGEHTFMVIGESADFMKANLEAGKTYYALVTPRMGVWKARFSLHPVHKPTETNVNFTQATPEFNSWVSSTKPVVMNSKANIWQTENQESVSEKRKEYFTTWQSKTLAALQENTLHADDGK